MILISFCLFRSQNVAGTGKLYETLAKHKVWSKLVRVSLDNPSRHLAMLGHLSQWLSRSDLPDIEPRMG